METASRGSTPPDIGRLRPLNPSARALLQSLPPCASKRHFAKRPMAVPRLGGRAQRTASFAVWPNEPSQPDATGSSVAGWPNEPDGADRSRFVRSTRPPAPVCPGKPDQAQRHDLGRTNPRCQTRRRDEPDRADQARKAATRPAVSWPNEPERPPRRRVGRNVRFGRTNPEPRHARRLYLLPLGSIRVLAFRLKILLYFSCCLQGGLFLRSLRLYRLSAFERTAPSQSRRSERIPRRAHATAGLFWPAEPKGHPIRHLAKRTQGAPSRDFGQTNPSGRPIRIFAKRTRRATEPLVFLQTNPRCSPVQVWAK